MGITETFLENERFESNMRKENEGEKKMKKKIIMLFITTLSIACLIACTKEGGEGEKASNVLIEATAIAEAPITPEEPTEEKLKLTDFTNLPKVAKQVGFSFRGLENFVGDEYEFGSFSMKEDVVEVNGMIVAEPYATMKLIYKKPIGLGLFMNIEVVMFPYEGEDVVSAKYNPICYVSTTQINGIDVHLSEYILQMVKPDYEMTEEDQEFIDSGKGSFGVDSIGGGPSFFRTMYWVEDGIYYEMYFGEPSFPVETAEGLVAEYMAAELS